jgi:hypothetical protein
MNRKLVNKLVRKFLKKLSDTHGFSLYKSTILMRASNGILQVISFDKPPSGLRCHIVLIPTYVPTNVIHYSIGNRLNYLNTNLSGIWCTGDSEDEIMHDLGIINELIEKNALPWLRENSTPISLIKILEEDLRNESKCSAICPRHLIYLYIGFSYLFIKEYKNAKIALEEALKRTGAVEMEPWSLIQPLLELLRMGRFDLIDKNMESYCQYTYENLKLEKLSNRDSG